MQAVMTCLLGCLVEQLTTEMRAEMHGIEAQVQRRIAIQGEVPERRLVDELV